MFDISAAQQQPEHTSTPTTHSPTTHGCPELDELAAMFARRRQLDAETAALIAVIDHDGLTETHTGHHTAGWIAQTDQQPINQARHQVRVARHLVSPRLQPLRDAFNAGTIGLQHIAAFNRAANPRNLDDLCDLAPHLIELAKVATFDRWNQELRGIAEQLDQDGGYDPATDPTNNQLRITPLTSGYTHITGTLVGELALTIASIINAATDNTLARHRSDRDQLAEVGHDHEIPSRPQAAAEALAELLQRAAATPDHLGHTLKPEAVIIIHPNNPGPDGNPTVTDISGNLVSTTLINWAISTGLTRLLETTPSGDPLRVGFAQRFANQHQRRALSIRDGGCTFPGCTTPTNGCDAHHVTHWSPKKHSGPTDIDNLALLCRHHHRITHRSGWTMHLAPTADPNHTAFAWTTPAGHTLHSQRHHTLLRPPE